MLKNDKGDIIEGNKKNNNKKKKDSYCDNCSFYALQSEVMGLKRRC